MSGFQDIEALRRNSLEKLLKAQEEHALIDRVLSAMPAGTPVPTAVYAAGYCAQALLQFKGSSLRDRLLELYPPLALAVVADGSLTQKPMKYVRDRELECADVEPIYPVVTRFDKGLGTSAGGLRWWTTLGGLDVEVNLADTQGVELDVDTKQWELRIHSYASGAIGYYRQSIEAVVDRTRLTHRLELRHRLLHEQPLRLRPRATRFISALLERADRFPDEPLTLPGRADNGAARHWLDGVGDFWQVFDEQGAAALLADVEDYRACLPQRLAEADNAFDRVEAALRAFFASRGGWPTSNWDLTSRRCNKLNKYLSQVCGFVVSAQPENWDSTSDMLHVRVRVPNTVEERLFAIPCLPNKFLRLQDIPG